MNSKSQIIRPSVLFEYNIYFKISIEVQNFIFIKLKNLDSLVLEYLKNVLIS